MNIIKPSYSITYFPDDADKRIEAVARTCYKSEDASSATSAGPFLSRLHNSGHTAMVEHASASVTFVCSRGISHEMVRHRLASFAQESTRYCNYSKERFGNQITVIKPKYVTEKPHLYRSWKTAMEAAELTYFFQLEKGATPQEARGCLPIDLKTEIVVTANLREWMHIFTLRCDGHAHPEMRRLMQPLAANFAAILPELFGEWGTR